MRIRIGGKSPLGGILFAIIGIFIIFSGNSIKKEQEEFIKNAKTATAQVTDVRSEQVRKSYRSNGKTKYKTVTEHYAYLTFEADGIKYTNARVKADNLVRNQSVEIYYNSKNPANVMLELPNPENSGLVMTLFGLVFVGIGGVIVFLYFKNREPRY